MKKHRPHRVHLGRRGVDGRIGHPVCNQRNFKSAFRNETKPENEIRVVTCKKCLRYIGVTTP